MLILFYCIRLDIKLLHFNRATHFYNDFKERHRFSMGGIISVIQDSNGSNCFSQTREEKKHSAPTKLAGSRDFYCSACAEHSYVDITDCSDSKRIENDHLCRLDISFGSRKWTLAVIKIVLELK